MKRIVFLIALITPIFATGSYWEVSVGEMTCFARTSADIADESSNQIVGHAYLGMALAHTYKAEEFYKRYNSTGKSAVLWAQFFSGYGFDGISASNISLRINSEVIELSEIEGDIEEGFHIAGDKAFQAWTKFVEFQNAEIQLQLSNGSVYIFPLGTKNLSSVDRMLQVCPS